MPSCMINQDTSTLLTKSIFFSPRNAFSEYMSNIQFGKHIECEHWYYKVRNRNALKAHTEAVHKGIGYKCAFGQIYFCKS